MEGEKENRKQLNYMNTPTFEQQRNRIIEAYFEDKIKPMDTDFCFCGTLAGGDSGWCDNLFKTYAGYSKREYIRMEDALLNRLIPFGVVTPEDMCEAHDEPAQWGGGIKNDSSIEEYEDALFQGMSDALDVLKEIHESRGEKTDAFEFKKRELVNN